MQTIRCLCTALATMKERCNPMRFFCGVFWSYLGERPGRPVAVIAVLFLCSCAKPQLPPMPDTYIPPTDVPTIGNTPQMPEIRPVPPPKPARPAVVDAMISKAKQHLNQNRPDAAFRTLERALAVDGYDPIIWHLMAKAQLEKGDFNQAKTLAGKSNTLAGDNTDLRELNRKIISQAESQLSRN